MSTEDQECDEETQLERVYGPTVALRFMTSEDVKLGFSLSVEWYDKPTPGEIIVTAEGLMERYAKITTPQPRPLEDLTNIIRRTVQREGRPL